MCILIGATRTTRSPTAGASNVRGDIHTICIESFWSILKRAYMGTFHWLSLKQPPAVLGRVL